LVFFVIDSLTTFISLLLLVFKVYKDRSFIRIGVPWELKKDNDLDVIIWVIGVDSVITRVYKYKRTDNKGWCCWKLGFSEGINFYLLCLIFFNTYSFLVISFETDWTSYSYPLPSNSVILYEALSEWIVITKMKSS